jgi:predicted DNA-binding transcriptional regulator
VLTGPQRTELNHRILSTLIELDRGVKAFELTAHLQVAQRDVVGRLQVLKHRGMVTYKRNSRAQSAAGLWVISEQGRQMVGQMTK